jgi:hypothetical protein
LKKQKTGCNTGRGILSTNEEEITSAIFPNPAKGNINIRFESLENEKVGIMLMDNSGKVKLRSEQIYPEGSQVKSINTTGLTKGTYFVKIIKNGKPSKTLSVVIQ